MYIKSLISILLLTTPMLGGCQQQNTPQDTAKPLSPHQLDTQQSVSRFTGVLQETFNAGGYTYVKIQFDKQPVWAAGPVTPVKQGDNISFSGRMPMKNFHSKSLNRDFPVIYFVSSFTVNGEKLQMDAPDPHSNIHANIQTTLKDFKTAENGQTIAEIMDNKDRLAGTNIKIRGQVTQYTANVMGKNWLHIRDHSSRQDLTVTTDSSAAVGDIVLIEGTLVKDRDFGYGYVYKAIIDNGKLAVEK